MGAKVCDFEGWATKNDLKCADGRTIRKNAFKVNDGKKVPLLWNHEHGDPTRVLGHAILENREDGVYAWGYFNDTPAGQHAKECLKHGDVESLSIWADQLQEMSGNVMSGNIRELSLVIAGANPGAYVESAVSHGMPKDDEEDEGIFYTGEPIVHHLSHAAENDDDKVSKKDNKDKNEDDETIEEVFNSLNEKQKLAVAAIVGQAIQDTKEEVKNNDDDGEKEEKKMSHNVFDKEKTESGGFLSHSDMKTIFDDAKKMGSLKSAVEYHQENGVLKHAIPTDGMVTATGSQTYGFNDPEMLFPEYKTLNNPPEWISRNMNWVSGVMAEVHRTPFSRIKSVFADITEDEARAKGYIKGKEKKTEVFTTLKRTTSPQTIYKFQKMDRDDVVDITDFDAVAWIRSEMRIMLNEEIARAILIGDGRQSDAEDKIKEENVRPIAKDVDLFNVKAKVSVSSSATAQEIAKATIDEIIRSRKNYKGSGNPKFYTTEDVITEMLLLEDGIGHKLYKTEAELATALRVREIVTVEPMSDTEINEKPLIGVIVNLADYNVGADKGGEVNMFDDFDLNFNKYEYLIETRMSGALTKPFSAITITLDKGAAG